MIPGDRRTPEQGRRDVVASVGLALALMILAVCCGMWMWWTYPSG